MSKPFQAFASCQPGLEPFVAAELTELDFAGAAEAGGVAFTTDTAGVMRAAFELGCASHVLLRLAEFPCRALGELQRKAADLPWSDWLRSNVPIVLRATSTRSRVYHTRAISERIANAIATAIVPAPAVATNDADYAARIAIRFHSDVCTISLDATTTPLHRRGYRLQGAKAPLREDLAHALVRAAAPTVDDAILDPFCGSGTIAIEAAGIRRGLAPGRLRAPPLEHLALFEPTVWARVRSAASERMIDPQPATGLPIAASDRDDGAVAAARANAERADVADAIDFRTSAITAHPWFEGSAPPRGVVATNPPFGKRIGQRDLLNLYQALGHRIRGLGTDWRAALLAHDVRLARRTGIPLAAAFTTKHGGISVTALTTSTTDRGAPREPGPDQP
ncbi:MAG: class I SAM-dependent RNA methyltransferase [bacterium]|nr:class I SAM-dependent RNA methyltransferase [bacterium]